jgi:hypothetical protein
MPSSWGATPQPAVRLLQKTGMDLNQSFSVFVNAPAISPI